MFVLWLVDALTPSSRSKGSVRSENKIDVEDEEYLRAMARAERRIARALLREAEARQDLPSGQPEANTAVKIQVDAAGPNPCAADGHSETQSNAEEAVTQPHTEVLAPSAIARFEAKAPQSASEAIREFVESQQIRYLVHFTQVENLASILADGLVGRRTISDRRIKAHTNDQLRLDNVRDAISCSISFPNYRMFYRVRCENPGSDWAVLRLKPELLWRKHCLFCIDNAASRIVSQTPPKARTGISALQSMFLNHQNMPLREKLDIPIHWPTNPQAEVLVLDVIEPDQFIDVCFDSKDRINDMQKIREIASPFKSLLPFRHNRDLFDPRADYSHWR